MSYYVTVGQLWKERVREAVKQLGAYLHSEGYTDGSTTWTVLIELNIQRWELEDRLRKLMNCTGWMKVVEYSDDNILESCGS